MAQIKPDMETFAKIKVVGVGGGGGNSVSRMVEGKIQGVELIAINADSQDLHHCLAPQKLLIGKNLTKGLGAGMNPDIGRQAAEENRDEIHEVLKGADLVFITYGLGGGVGTGAGPIVAEAARDVGALTVGVVTKPFSFEGSQRMHIAIEGLNRLQDKVDTLITIPNDKLLQTIERNTSLTDAFKVVDDVLRQAVQGISDIIVTPGLVNVDFADLKTVMTGAGSALMGIGRATGDDRAVEAAKAAINSPLLEVSIEGAKGVIFNVAGGADMTMMEINEAAKVITDSIDPQAKVIFGAVTDSQLKKGEIKITVIAAGFGEQALKKEREEKRAEIRTETVSKQEAPSVKKPSGFSGQVTPIDSSDEEWDIPAFIRKKMK
jgi:cell division protein FtsZ